MLATSKVHTFPSKYFIDQIYLIFYLRTFFTVPLSNPKGLCTAIHVKINNINKLTIWK